MTLRPGDRLGAYVVEQLLGAGGMGQVYKCRDTRLGRTVAIKVIAPELASDPSFLERFEREARVLSTLNHPHICGLYDVGEHAGTRYVVMEFLEGRTVADWITGERARLPRAQLLDRVLAMALQIADALDHAHRRGVVHRDLKPSNIVISESGLKLVDFGLARLVTPATAANDAPTELGMTQPGAIIGTMPYMAPEQLEGAAADPRTDVWAFGCVFHELLSGSRAFNGSTKTELIAAIVNREVPFPDGVDPGRRPLLEHFHQRCLAKSPADRWASGRDVSMELQWASRPAVAAIPPTTRSSWPGWVAAVLLTGIASAMLARSSSPVADDAVRRLSIVIPQSTAYNIGGLPNAFAISPDGSTVAHLNWRDGRAERLHLRSLNGFDSVPIVGSDGAIAPFFSPDNQWVGFLVGTQIKKVAVAGGPVVIVCQTSDRPSQPSWSADNRIVFADVRGIHVVPSGGGKPELLLGIDANRDEVAFNSPALLDDGRTLLFAIRRSVGGWNAGQIVSHRVDTGERKVLIDGGYAPRLLPDGYLLFSRAASLMAVAINVNTLKMSGSPAPVLDRSINNATFGWSLVSASSNGTLIYSQSMPRTPSRIVWVDRLGRFEPAVSDLKVFEHPRLSPDGRHFAVGSRDPGTDIWLGNVATRTLERFTFSPGEDESPIWHPRGNQIAFATTRDGARFTMTKPLDGSTDEQPIGQHGQWHQHLGAWSPDAQTVAITIAENTGLPWNLFRLRPGSGAAIPDVSSAHTTQAPAFSPDGHWIAYASDESGRFEIYVDSASGVGKKRQVTTEGGAEPLWSRDGKELFFRSGDRMMAVDVKGGEILGLGRPRVLFEGRFEQIDWGERNYDVSSDAKRFLMIRSESPRQGAEIRVVLNWRSELQTRVRR